MTRVRDLIQALQRCNPDLEVRVFNDVSARWEKIQRVEPRSIKDDPDDEDSIAIVGIE